MAINKWVSTHPTAAGIYWVSVKPEDREPRPFVKLAPVFQIMVTPAGDVFELGGDKTDPTYTIETLPEYANSGSVRYKAVQAAKQADPWSY